MPWAAPWASSPAPAVGAASVPTDTPPRSVRPAARLAGVLTVPGDKSISHRALLLNALAEGTARVRGLGLGADVRSTERCLQALGVAIEPAGDVGRIVHGAGAAGLREPDDVLDAGNSGTTM